MIKAIIFDMDGVILDSETICNQVWRLVAKDFGLDDIEEGIKKCLGTNINDTCRILHELYGQDFPTDDFVKRVTDGFRDVEFSSGIPLMPYAKECLEKLKQSNRYKIALASSTKGSTVERQLTRAGVIQYFETRTTGEMVKHSKPDPQIYLLACQSLGLAPEECIAVEDSPNGIKSAYAAGMKAVMVPDKIQPNEEIKALCWKIFPSLKDFSECDFSRE